MQEQNALIKEIEQSGVNQDTAIVLKNSFMPFFEQADKIALEAKSIIVKSADDIDLMTEAREKRLELKRIRVEVEKQRKQLKEDSIRKGKAIDGMANIIKYLIVPIEDHLQLQEDFVKIQEEKRLDEIENKRIAQLQQYDVETEYYGLRNMPEDGFQQLLKISKETWEHKKAEEQRIEEERIELEKKEKAEQERIRQENIQLKKEAEERRKLEQERFAKEKDERERREKEELKRKQEEEKRLESERKKTEAERKKREELERQETERKQKEEAEKQRFVEEQRQKELAPDKEKLIDFEKRLMAIELPNLSDEKAKKILQNTVGLLIKVSEYIKTQVISL